MKIQYFNTCWNDLKSSPGWKGKICLLALLSMVPVFGQIVTFGYAYGWAREVAWGMRGPLPRDVFSNHDGMFWRRGWFSVVVFIAWAIVPAAIILAGYAMLMAGFGIDLASYFRGSYGTFNPGLLLGGLFVCLVGAVLGLFTTVFSWAGCIRSAIYNKLKPGVQFGKILKMAHRDSFGLLKIFGMRICIYLIFEFALEIVFSLVIWAAIVPLGYALQSNAGMSVALAIALIALIAVFFLAYIYAAAIFTVFSELMVARAVGYWAYQFDVARWGGPNDLLPFEVDSEACPKPDYGRNDPSER